MDTTTSDSFANIIANLKLNSSVVLANLNGYLANAANTSDSDLTGVIAADVGASSSTNAKLTATSPITLPPSLVNQYKSFFKTIKIFVASNKDGIQRFILFRLANSN